MMENVFQDQPVNNNLTVRSFFPFIFFLSKCNLVIYMLLIVKIAFSGFELNTSH